MGPGRLLRRVLQIASPASEALYQVADQINRRLDEVIGELQEQRRGLGPQPNERREAPTYRAGDFVVRPANIVPGSATNPLPLLVGPQTYNPGHPGYDPRLVRNFPDRIFNAERGSDNAVLAELVGRAEHGQVPSTSWDAILADMLAEVAAAPHVGEVFVRRIFIEDYLAELERTYRAGYRPGWRRLEDALFLYWLVRQAQPRTIVQCGVGNGLSAALMMMALARNGPDGALHLIDLPPVFDPSDPGWTIASKIYDVVIPEGKTIGWMVPDAYRDRVAVWNGDTHDLLPKVAEQLGAIDLFHHDSDHIYDSMMVEFHEARRKLSAGGLIVADDISWNASLWDFAEQCGVPGYNFKGAVGVAFF